MKKFFINQTFKSSSQFWGSAKKGIVIHCSSSARCWIWALAATAASRLSLNTSAFGFKSAVGVPACVSQAWLELSSRGYKCWTGLSSMPFAVLSWTAWMIPSFARYVLFTIAGGQLLQFLLSVFIITTYATFGWRLAALCVRLCHSFKAVKYSLCHRLQRLFLQFMRYLVRLCLSSFSILHVFSSGNWLVR